MSQAEVEEGAAVEVAGAADEVEGAADAVNGAAVESTDVAAPRKGTPVALPLHHAGNLPGSTLMSLAATGWAAGGGKPKTKWKSLAYPRGTWWAASTTSKNTACAKDSDSDERSRPSQGAHHKLSRSSRAPATEHPTMIFVQPPTLTRRSNGLWRNSSIARPTLLNVTVGHWRPNATTLGWQFAKDAMRWMLV